MMQPARNTARWALSGIAGGLGLTARHAARRRLAGRWGIILGYHRVIPADECDSPYRMGMSADLFEAQIRWIASRHRIVSMEEFLWWRASDRTPPEDLIILTFDDGYRDNLTQAAPLLKDLGIPALFYVTSSGLTGRMPYWPETLGQMLLMTRARSVTLDLDPGSSARSPVSYEIATPEDRTRSCLRMVESLRRLPAARIMEAIETLAELLGVDPAHAQERTPRLLGAGDIRALIADGFAIGSHSVSHPYLPSEDEVVQRREIEESRRAIEEAARSPVTDFCYPGGGYDERTQSMVREAGYRSAVTWDTGIAGPADDPYSLPRKGIGPALAAGPSGRFSAAMMEGEISGLVGTLTRRRQRGR
jgi:peptidoglycan/xylan/chitin deacetylase (PgdA/CDA1 family)